MTPLGPNSALPVRRPELAGRITAAVLACLSFGRASATPPAPQPLAPLWLWQPAPSIEWIEPIGDPNATALLLATRDGSLQIVDLQNGQPQLTPSILAKPGVAAAGIEARADVTYCFDRFRVYAIALPPPAALRWQVGAWREGLGEGTATTMPWEQMFQGDPEDLRRIVAAQATSEGLLFARDDGRMALLDSADGHIRWQMALGQSTSIRLLARAQAAAVLWKRGTHVAAAFIDLSTGTRSDLPLATDAAWPTWVALADQGLVVVHPDRVSLWKAAGSQHVFDLPGAARILAATVVLQSPPTGEARERLLFGSTDGLIRSIDPTTGKTIWSAADQPEDTAHWTVWLVRGDLLITATIEAITFRSLATGEALARISLTPDEQLLDVGLTAHRAWLLKSKLSAGNRALNLVAAERPTAAETRSTSRAVGPLACYDLGPADPFLRAVWLADRVVVAARTGLCAYRLR